MNATILRIRAGLENERGPMYMEPAIAAFHSFSSKEKKVHLEIGLIEGKLGFFVRSPDEETGLCESQLYAQYPDIDIEYVQEDPFTVLQEEEVAYLDLKLSSPEVYPIKRHPQFDDLLARVNVDPIAGITSTLVRYNEPGMRGHVQVVLQPLHSSYRRRALRFLPLLRKGFASISSRYANFFTKIQLARGWRRIAFLPIAIFLGGFRAWPGFNKFFVGSVSFSTGEISYSSERQDDLEKASSRSHDREDSIGGAVDKVNRLLFLCNVRVCIIYPKGKRPQATKKLMEIAGSFRQFSLPQSNDFSYGKTNVSSSLPLGFTAAPFILSTEEIATLWHVPTLQVQTPNLDWVLSKKLEPPIHLPVLVPGKEDKELTILGKANFRGSHMEFGIRTDDRRRHIYSIGKTGMGKSTLLENMIYSDIHAGRGVGVIDPHGDLIESIMQFIPKNRSNDVVLFDPADKEYPISFNILDCPDVDQRNLVASGLMSVFTKLWPEAFSGRMEHILRNTLLALLETEGTSMLGIMRIFADDTYRKKIVSKVTNPMVKSFWEDEYANWSDKYRTEAIAAIQNKIGQLLTTPLIRNIVGQVKSTLDIRHAMDSGKIVLVNLSKGRLGEDTSAFLGSMLVTKFQIDAMSRADIPEEQRRDFFLYVDEFQNFATESFATILSEARKYRLSLTMANQYVGQLLIGERNTSLRDAVFGNVGTLVTFQVGSDDAEQFSLQFEEMVLPKDILSLPKYHAYVRLMIDGMPSKPFSVATLPPPKYKQDPGRLDTIRKLSRERYAQKRSVVEGKISMWASKATEGRTKSNAEAKGKEKEEEEIKKARKKGMKLAEYRAWRDREMWTNDFNVLRKKDVLGEELSADEIKQKEYLIKKLEASGGIPQMSKGLLELKEKRKTSN